MNFILMIGMGGVHTYPTQIYKVQEREVLFPRGQLIALVQELTAPLVELAQTELALAPAFLSEFLLVSQFLRMRKTAKRTGSMVVLLQSYITH
ncbi:MAG: hypothetical protein KDD62_02340 [Bdellovibrionales bacterium]|nr:hypothetical protein [Bdellovibrionales bacterium]